jgi:2-octaprenyl-6-methoxyphenol hydroxylase
VEEKMTITKTYDVVVVGAGPVGSVLALSLANAGMRVAVVEKLSKDKVLSSTQDIRAYALSSATIDFLTAIQVWPKVSKDSAPIHKIQISSGDSPSVVTFETPSDLKLAHPSMGAILPAFKMRQACFSEVIATEMIDVYHGVSVASLQHQSDKRAYLTLSNGTVLVSHLLVGADGHSSMIREKAGIDFIEHQYDQKALITVIDHQKNHEGMAYEKFYASGPFATLPMQGNQSGIVWIGQAQEIEALLSLEESLFKELVQERYPSVGEITKVGSKYQYPLTLKFSNSVYNNRVVLVGDAAHAIHPLAGQSLNLGFRDVMMLVETLKPIYNLGLDIGHETALAHYQQSRRFDTLELIATTHGLNHLFSNENPLLKTLRKVGLRAFSKIPGGASYATRHAMGQTGYRAIET